MSTINTIVQIVHQDTGMSFPLTAVRTTDSPGFSAGEITVVDAEESVQVEYPTPRHIGLRLLSGDDVKVGVVSGTYPFRLSGANDFMILRLDVEGLRETQTIQVTDEDAAAGSLDGDYITLEGKSGTWAIWFDVAGGTSEPVHGMTNSHEITTVVAADPALSVGEKMYDELSANAAFLADFVITFDGVDLLTIRDRHTGTRDNIAETGTEFTVATTQAGAASPTVYLRSTGSSQLLVSVIPN